MKKIFAILLTGFALAACSKQNATPTQPVNDMVDTTVLSRLYTGMFMNGPYGIVSGTVNIYEDSGGYKLALKDFQTSNGPDLHVYLSQEQQPIHFIDLGKLRSTNGNQVYSLTDSVDFEAYKYALIHCQQYNHLFGSTLLEKQ